MMSEVVFNEGEQDIYKLRTIAWTIPNFLDFLLYEDIREVLAVNTPHAKHQLRLQILGHNKDIIELSYLYNSNIFMKGELFSFYSSFPAYKKLGEFNFKFVEAGKWQYLGSFYRRDINVEDDVRENYCGPDASITFKFAFQILKFESLSGELNSVKNPLGNDLKTVLNTKLFADVTVKSKDGKEYKVHKVILAARSKVFKAYLQHDNVESKINVIESQFESDILEDVLSFIYSDQILEIKETSEKLLELLSAADYYHLEGLRSLCEKQLKKHLTADNAKEMLEISNTFAATSLQGSASDFIKRIYFYEVLDPNWMIHYFKYHSI